MTEERARVGEIEIAYDTIGDPSGKPLLLIMGLGTQLIHWDRGLCERFAERGFFVIRFDNRDCGHSTHIRAPVPNLAAAMAGLKIDAPYLLADMAEDGFGLLDHLGIEAAHVAGASMGGMIAQEMALRRPERVRSLVSIMSTTGARRPGRPRLRVLGVLFRRAPEEKDAYIEHTVRVFKMIGSKGFPIDEDRLRRLAAEGYERGHSAAGTGRQLAAILASGDRTPRLRELRVPTTVFHGKSDPLVPFRAGKATARATPGARLIAIPGMGHDLPSAVWPRLVDAVAETAEQAAPERAAAEPEQSAAVRRGASGG